MATTLPRTGYAPVNGLQMYYEIFGTPNADVPRCWCCTARWGRSTCSGPPAAWPRPGR